MPIIETSARNAACDAIVDLIDAGAAAGTLLFQTSATATVAKLDFSYPAFGAASAGTATANAITSDANATGGTIARAVARNSDLATVVEFTVTETGGGGDIELSSLTIGAGDTVSVSSLTLTVPAS